jgi:hypothetical protein
VIGLIVGWLPPTPTDEALWHVQHLDGDEEDLDEDEVIECLVPEEGVAETAAAEAGTGQGGKMDVVDLCDEEEEEPIVRRGSARLATSGSSSASLTKKDSSGSLAAKAAPPTVAPTAPDTSGDSEAEFDEKIGVAQRVQLPSIIRQASGVARGTPAWRAPPLTNALGVQAMRVEFTRVLGLMNDELKRRGGGFSREARKLWEQSLRDAETTADLRTPLMELEALVRDIQTAEDKRDAEEVRLAKEAERKEMAAEGWLFDSSASEFIGAQARRFFKGFGRSDGTIVAYLPPEKNDNVALWHMEHSDGDSEDLELHDLQKALRCFEQDLQEDDEEEEGGEEDGDSDGEDSDASSEASDDSQEEDKLYAPSGSGGATLWPTFEVRQRWMAALSNAQTIGEVGLALNAFLEQAEAFGMLAPDPFAQEQVLKPRQAKLAVKPSAYKVDHYSVDDSPPDSPQPARSSSRNRMGKAKQQKQVEAGRDRPMRAAARAVKSYAE